MTPVNGVTSVADYFSREECLGGGDWGIPSGGFAYAGTAGGGVFRSVQSTAAVRVIPRARPRPDHPRAPESLVITAGETRALRWLIRGDVSASAR